MKEKFCEKYFEDNVKPKHLTEFCQKTHGGKNISEGLIRKIRKNPYQS